MRILLDTHILYWVLFEPASLPPNVRADLQDPENDVLFSAASVWEIAIKTAIGRLQLRVDVSDIAPAATGAGFSELPIVGSAAAGVAALPLHHRDPFDRLLIAQALAEPALFYTRDARLERYSELVRRV